MRFKEPSEDKQPRSVIPNPGALRPHHPPAGRQNRRQVYLSRSARLIEKGPDVAGLVFSLVGSDATRYSSDFQADDVWLCMRLPTALVRDWRPHPVPSGLRCKSASVASGFMMMLRGGGDSPWGTGEKS
jgi:hypothetical protein